MLFLAETFGGLAPPAIAHMHWLVARSKRVDRTTYESWAAPSFLTHWTQRLSAAIIGGDARRALNAIAAGSFLSPSPPPPRFGPGSNTQTGRGH